METTMETTMGTKQKQQKNLFLLPTDKPSRLSDCHNDKLHLDDVRYLRSYQNIYITSDEYIGLSYYLDGNLVRKGVVDDKDYWEVRQDYKKIILTTDQDLIKDGVQAIDDDFLEWFVKNPLCDYISTPIIKLCENCGQQFCDNRDCRGYIDKPYYLLAYPETITERTITYCDGYEINSKEIIIPKEETKQETIEEASKDYIENTMKFSFNSLETKTQANRMLKCAEFGAKWQAERMYSEEELLKILESHKDNLEFDKDRFEHDRWFEQFKKK